jgi:mycothiol synthase
MGIDIGPFDPTQAPEDDLVDYHRLVLAAGRVDRPDEEPPSYDSVVEHLQVPMTARGPSRFWAARRGGRLVGLANVSLPNDENESLAITDIRVHPEIRRAGAGTSLLRAALPTLREQKRSVVTGWGVTEDGAGARWASALGFRVVHHDVLQMLTFADTDRRLWQVPAPEGYRLAKWIGIAPDELVKSYAEARTAIHDAPGEDSTFRHPSWTVERVRAHEDDLRERGVEQHVAVAVHEATDNVVGLTELEIYPNSPDLGCQNDTAVLAAHRGRGLGRFIKAGMVRWLIEERPAVRRIATSTAADNTFMIAVNHQIGFRSVRSMIDVEAPVDALEARL